MPPIQLSRAQDTDSALYAASQLWCVICSVGSPGPVLGSTRKCWVRHFIVPPEGTLLRHYWEPLCTRVLWGHQGAFSVMLQTGVIIVLHNCDRCCPSYIEAEIKLNAAKLIHWSSSLKDTKYNHKVFFPLFLSLFNHFVVFLSDQNQSGSQEPSYGCI